MPDPGCHFARLLVKHDRAIISYIMTFIPRRDDAEEVLQRTATVIWEKFQEYDHAREFLPWAITIAYFEVLNFRKEQARSRLIFNEDLLSALAEDRQTLEPVLERQREALQQCLARMHPQSRELLTQRYAGSFSIAELAHAAGKTVKSIYRQLYKLRQQVARCVEIRLAGTPS